MKKIVLRSKEDFYWHKKKLDLDGKYEYKHIGKPDKYPCIIISEFYDDPNGPYTYYHEFYYKQTEKIKCDHCGNTKVKTFWPKLN